MDVPFYPQFQVNLEITSQVIVFHLSALRSVRHSIILVIHQYVYQIPYSAPKVKS